MDKLNSKCLRVEKSFFDLVHSFMDDFEEKMNIKISTTKATKIIADKIEAAGGLII